MTNYRSMLGYIEGKVIAKNEETHQCVVKMLRVGFDVTLTPRLFDSIEVGGRVALWLHTHVREDILALYGFGSDAERLFFKQLLGVSGLGPKTALSLLSEHGVQRLIQLLVKKDSDSISSAAGVGKKLAQRLVLELAGKMEKWTWLEAAKKETPLSPSTTPTDAKPEMREDLSSALLNLGYLPVHIKNTLDKILDKEGLETEGFEICLRRALREMSNRAFASGGEAV